MAAWVSRVAYRAYFLLVHSEWRLVKGLRVPDTVCDWHDSMVRLNESYAFDGILRNASICRSRRNFYFWEIQLRQKLMDAVPVPGIYVALFRNLLRDKFEAAIMNYGYLLERNR
jgi:hypothetical protein